MVKSNNRKQRVADLIQTALAEILQREAQRLQCGMVTITDVNVTKDLTFAKIFVSVLDDSRVKESLMALNEASKFLRYELAHAVKLRMTPELKFIYDDSIVRGNRISSLISKALKDNKSDTDE